jgi:NAD(P)-dependent dehydrogenase (short-subunit alcohol dehydrogenase family)
MEVMTKQSMQGKICLVTGASGGVGKAAAEGLAARGAEVILVGRNLQKTSQAAEEIKNKTRNPSVSYLLADFSDLQQVRDLAGRFEERYERLDVLLNNAGTYLIGRKETPQGIELMFQINHLAPFLLTTLLLDLLKHSAPARIVNVASSSHYNAKANFDDLRSQSGSFGMNGYGRSKLANVLFTYELARRLEGSGVTVNAVHPGFVATDLWQRNIPLIGRLLKYLSSFFALTPEQGADTLIYLAASEEVDGISGKYFFQRKARRSSAVSYDEDVARHLWELSEKLTSA